MRNAPHVGTVARQVLTALWVGSLWTVGYLVAPTLFASLSDTALAGTIAGSMFRVEAWVSVAMALLVGGLTYRTVIDSRTKKSSLILIGAMTACTAIGYFCLHPLMAALRATAPAGILADGARLKFGMLHGLASSLYFVESVLGLFLLYNDVPSTHRAQH